MASKLVAALALLCLVAAAAGDVIGGTKGNKHKARICSPQHCCVTQGDFGIGRCGNVLLGFEARNTPTDAVYIANVVADLSEVAHSSPDIANCKLVKKWAHYGADVETFQYFSNKAAVFTLSDKTVVTIVYGMAAIFKAHDTVYVTFSYAGYTLAAGSGRKLLHGQNSPFPAAVAPFAPVPGALVNDFYQQYTQHFLANGLGDALHELLHDAERLVVGGLGEGAAAAQFIALAHPRKLRAAYLFGVPKLGNQAFVDAYAAAVGRRTYSWWNKFDAVPLFPPTTPAEAAILPARLRTVWPAAAQLPWSEWWRITDSQVCHNLATATPAEQDVLTSACGVAPSCTPNFDDHDFDAYLFAVRSCAASDGCTEYLSIIS